MTEGNHTLEHEKKKNLARGKYEQEVGKVKVSRDTGEGVHINKGATSTLHRAREQARESQLNILSGQDLP